MGTWGPGLYANDLAKDLKSTVGAVLMLPLEPTALIHLITGTYPDQSSQDGEADYTTFWLVLADSFHKGGLSEPDLFVRAISIVDSGMDLQYPERQEMSESNRRKREAALVDLRERLTKPPPSKKRKTLSEPQPLVLNTGDLFVYPVFIYGQCINPHSSRWEHDQKAWGAACIVKSDHVFEYLACYWPLVLSSRFDMANKPTANDLLILGKRELEHPPRLTRQLEPELIPDVNWELKRPGTCSKLHFQRVQLEILDNLAVDEKILASRFPRMRDGRYQTVNNISMANSLGASPESDGALGCLEDIVK